jgi:hypothetical protein
VNDTIVGGTGAYTGATGTLVPHFSGTTLAGPNAYRVPFNIAPQALLSGVILNREPCERHVADNPAYIALKHALARSLRSGFAVLPMPQVGPWKASLRIRAAPTRSLKIEPL